MSAIKHKICHLTSAHTRYDIRIFHKECKSLYNAGYDVSLVVADGCGDEIIDGVKIFDVGKHPVSRIRRFTQMSKIIFKKALELDSQIYHFHDPELISAGKRLVRCGKKVIFDAHEDFSEAILTRYYIPSFVRSGFSKIYSRYERRAAEKFSAIIGATPHIGNKFSKMNPLVYTVANFPLPEFFNSVDYEKRIPEVVYAGGISEERCIREMILACGKAKVMLNLAGPFDSEVLLSECQNMPEWSFVRYHGNVNRTKLLELFISCSAGLVLFHDLPNHSNAQPNKIFEYMSAGLPVIGSFFPLWKEIIEENECGICVNPADIDSIAQAVSEIVSNKIQCTRFGSNGKIAVEKMYNWANEQNVLLNLYEKLV